MTARDDKSHAKQVAYLAGPMRGLPEYNFPAFYAAAAALRKHGLDVWSPAENDVNEDGFDPAKDTAQPMRHYMRRDLPAVLNADMVCVLPGWEKSQGAQLEVHVARACGIPVYNAHDLSPASTPSHVAPNPLLSHECGGKNMVCSICGSLPIAKAGPWNCPHNACQYPNTCRDASRCVSAPSTTPRSGETPRTDGCTLPARQFAGHIKVCPASLMGDLERELATAERVYQAIERQGIPSAIRRSEPTIQLVRQAIFHVLDDREWDFENDEQRVDFADAVATWIPTERT